MDIIADGIIYFQSRDFMLERRLQGFSKIGEAEHTRKRSQIYFLKNQITGECAISVQNKWGAQIYIFKNANDANQFYKEINGIDTDIFSGLCRGDEGNMTFKVFYTRTYVESGDVYEGADYKEFNTLSEAWNYYKAIKDNDRNAQLWEGKNRLH